MRNIVLFFIALLFLISAKSNVYAGWTLVATAEESNDKYYLDFKRIKKNSGFTYAWYLTNYSRINKFGDKSDTTYMKADCQEFKYKWLSVTYYATDMGKGKVNATSERETDWYYPAPESVMEAVLKRTCNY